MDQNTALAMALTSMLTQKDLQETQPQNIEEVIEMIKATPTGEISKNLERNLKLEEMKTQRILLEMVNEGKVDVTTNSYSPFCEGD